MELSQELKDYLNLDEIKKIVKQNDWYTFCDKIESILYTPALSELYRFFRENNIDILPYVDFVPKAYYAYSKIKTINVPNGIKKLRAQAFYNCQVEQLILPSTLEIIMSFCFFGVKNLNVLKLPKNLEYVSRSAFKQSSIKTVYFEGDQEQFNKVFIDFPSHINVICN